MDEWMDGRTNVYNSIQTIHTVHTPYTYIAQIYLITPRYIHSIHIQYTHKAHMDGWTGVHIQMGYMYMVYMVNIYSTHTQIHTQHTYIVYGQSTHVWTDGRKNSTHIHDCIHAIHSKHTQHTYTVYLHSIKTEYTYTSQMYGFMLMCEERTYGRKKAAH